MWGIIFAISLIAVIAFAIMMFMAEKESTMKKVGIGMLILSLCLSLLSGFLWFKNRRANANKEIKENTD
jgi:hypothetical protein